VVATRNASGCLELDMTSIPGMVADKVLVVSGGTKSGNKLIANKDSNKIEYIYDDTIRNGIANDPRLFTLTLTESAKKDYSLDDGVLTLYYPEKMPDFSNVDGKRAPWYEHREQIKWVKFEGSPTNIGNYAFYGCRNLKSITFKDGLKTIGDYAFSGCYALTYVRFVYTLDRIGKGAFQNDSFLETVLFEDDPNGLYIDEDAFAGCVAIKDVYTSYVATNYMALGWFFIDFANESSNPLTVSEANPQLMLLHYGVITAERIEKSLTYITRLNNYALYKVKLNSSLVIPEGIAEIGKYALAYTPCVNLQLPSTLKVIDSKAFAGNSKLQEVEFNGYCPYSFASDAFSGVTATIWYPTAGWRTADLQNYGGTLTWRDKTTPKITKQPSSVKNANVGDNISFTIAAVGMNLSYQWQYSRDGGESWTKDTSATSTTYQRTVAKEDNNLQIRCVVTTAGANSARSNVVTITVGEPIVISSQPQNAEVVENNTASFKIVATGDTLSYQWQHSVDGGKTWTTPTSDSSKTANYKFKAVEKWNNTLVRCIITDQYGKTVTSNTASLKVRILPKITLQPTDVSCDAGKTAKFTLTATGTGLKYQWYYSADKGATWNAYGSESETATLSITTKASHNGWTLKCTVKDSYGSEIESSPVQLTVMTPLKITTQPQSAEVVENVTASFKIVATGDNLSYQWQYSTDGGTKWTTPGESTTSSRTANYKFKAVEKWNNMVLRCTITDGYGRKVTSNTVTLKVIMLPKITVQPQAVSCDVGKTATFTLTATGTGLKYQWYYSADKGATWKTYGTESTVPTLAVATKASHYGWMFKCVVADSYGNTVESEAVKLTVTNAVVIKTQPQDVSLQSGNKAVFQVEATGEDLTYQWKYSTDQGTTWKTPTSTSAKTASYSTTVTMGQNGVWVRCTITDKYGSKKTTRSAKITVTSSAPVIKTQPVDTMVNADEKAVFHVVAEGTGLTYQWKYSTDHGVTWKEATATSAKTATYSTIVTDKQDGVMVMCDITNKEGLKVSSKTATIHVISRIVIKTQPVDVTVNADEKAVFHVVAEGIGLTYQWKYSTDHGVTWKEATATSAKTDTYSTVVTDRQNGVMVMCDITNKAGIKVSTGTATIHVNPGIVIKTQPKAVKTTVGTKAEFKVVATGNALTYQWQYSLDKGATWKISTASCATTNNFTITAADKWNGMYLRCAITNAKGVKVVTNAVKLTVTAAVSEVEITELEEGDYLPEAEDDVLVPEEEEILPPVEELQ